MRRYRVAVRVLLAGVLAAAALRSGEVRAQPADRREHGERSLNSDNPITPDTRPTNELTELAEEHVNPRPDERIAPAGVAAAAGDNSFMFRNFLYARARSGPQDVHVLGAGGFELKRRYSARIELPGPGDFRPAGNIPSRERLVLQDFQVLYQGFPVTRATRTVFARADGMVVSLRARNLPRETEFTTEWTVPLQDAKARALADASRLLWTFSHAKTNVHDGEAGKGTPHFEFDTEGRDSPLEIWVDPQRTGVLAWSFVVRSEDRATPFARRYWVAARNEAKILESESQIAFAQPAPARDRIRVLGKGHGQCLAHPPVGPDPRGRASPSAISRYRRMLSTGACTEADGNYRFPADVGPATILARLKGPFCIIHNRAGNDLALSVRGDEHASINFTFSGCDEFSLAQLSAFRWVNHTHDFIADYLPANLVKLSMVPTNVNIDNATTNYPCNAYWKFDDNTLNFTRATGQDRKSDCPNKADSSLIFHEYGHGVDDELGGVHDMALSEGFGDSLSILLTGSSIIGPDYYGEGQHLRDADKEVVNWPELNNKEEHHRGLIYAGFTWELIKQIRQNASEEEALRTAKRLILGAAKMTRPAYRRRSDTASTSTSRQAPRTGRISKLRRGRETFRCRWTAPTSRRATNPDATLAARARATNGHASLTVSQSMNHGRDSETFPEREFAFLRDRAFLKRLSATAAGICEWRLSKRLVPDARRSAC